MKMSPQYKRLAEGLDSMHMRKRIQEQLVSVTNDLIELEKFHVARVFPHSDGSFTIQYRMNAISDKRDEYHAMILCGKLLGDDEDWPTHINNGKHQVMVFQDLRLVVPVFPFDPQLPAIADLCVTGKLPKIILLDKIEGIREFDSAVIDSFEVLGYRLERRCVIRHKLSYLRNDAKNPDSISIITKISRPVKMRETETCLELLQKYGFAGNDANDLTIPTSYYLDGAKGILVSESVPGKTLHDLTGEEQFVSACRAAASILNKLHKIDSRNLPVYAIENELKALYDRVSIISSVFPELNPDLKAAFETLESTARELDSDFEIACIHRDFYDKQVLYSPSRSTLLDWDSLASGDPAQDCGNFVAHLILRSMQHPANPQDIRKGIEAFENKYDISDDGFSKRKCWWQSASLLRLACLYSLRPKWQKLSKDLINSAISIFQSNQTQRKGVKEDHVF